MRERRSVLVSSRNMSNDKNRRSGADAGAIALCSPSCRRRRRVCQSGSGGVWVELRADKLSTPRRREAAEHTLWRDA